MRPMIFESRFWRLSPLEADPLSWFTGSLVPLVFAALNLVYGLSFVAATWSVIHHPVAAVAGVLLCTATCVLVHVLTRPLQRQLGWGRAAIAVGLSVIGFALSVIGYSGAVVSVELWWAPFGIALVIGSLGPYVPARVLVLLGAVATAIAVPLAWVVVREQPLPWGPLSTAVIIASPLVSAIVALAAFSVTVVSRSVPLIEKRTQAMLTLDPPRGAVNEQRERERLASLISRAAPFIEEIARTGVITAEDRSLAGNLARRLRDDLVTQSNLSWLDSVAHDRLVVVDPDHQAGRMRSAQRTALRALIRAILATPGTDAGSLLVELRAHPDGSTAVGVSLDFELPEGRRIMHLAPYYLALRGSVDDLEWRDDKFLRVTFNLPAEDGAARPRVTPS